MRAIAFEAAQAEGFRHNRCVVLIEASEESGSPDLPAHLDALVDRIGTPSLVLCLDSGCMDYERLWVTTSLRGLASGELRVDRCDGDVSVKSTSGSTRIGHCDGSEISVRSISGDVRMGLPSGIRVEADISTVSGKASLPEPAAPTGGERRPVRLKLKTVSGDVRIVRSV